MSVQKIVDCTDHMTGCHNKDAKCFTESFFDPMNAIDPEKKRVDLHMFNGSIVCRKAKIFKVVYPILSCIIGA